MTTAVLTREPRKSGSGEFVAPIHKVLHNLAIDPFTLDSVDRYKLKVLNKYHWMNVIAPKVESASNGLLIASIVVALIFQPPVALVAAMLISAQHLQQMTIVCGVFSTMSFGVAACLGLFHQRFLKVPNWYAVPLESFKQPIPEFVQQTIDDIKDQYSGWCLFQIEYFGFERRSLDPFLVIVTAAGRHHVEVWNESYQKQREA